jgi:hypothetical protein
MFLIDGLSPDLLRAAAWIFLFGVLVASRDLPVRYAVVISLIKVLIPVAYFTLNPSGEFHVSDDLDYFYEALPLLQRGYNPVSIFRDPFGLPLLMQQAGSKQHLAYPLWNLAGMSAFGPHYFSTVFLNVGVTFVAGLAFFRILKRIGFSRVYARLALAFFLLHWDTLAWASFMNLKDILSQALTLVVLLQFMRIAERPSLARLSEAGILLALLSLLRFYMPALLLIAGLVHFGLQAESLRRKALALFCLAGGALLGFYYFPPVSSALSNLNVWGIPFGISRFLLTPLPWSINAEYAFLFVPATLHLLFFVPALSTVSGLWKNYPASRLLFVYAAVVVLFYACVPMLQGTRQRLQIGFVFIWLEAHVLWMYGRYFLGSENKASAIPG